MEPTQDKEERGRALPKESDDGRRLRDYHRCRRRRRSRRHLVTVEQSSRRDGLSHHDVDRQRHARVLPLDLDVRERERSVTIATDSGLSRDRQKPPEERTVEADEPMPESLGCTLRSAKGSGDEAEAPWRHRQTGAIADSGTLAATMHSSANSGRSEPRSGIAGTVRMKSVMRARSRRTLRSCRGRHALAEPFATHATIPR